MMSDEARERYFIELFGLPVCIGRFRTRCYRSWIRTGISGDGQDGH